MVFGLFQIEGMRGIKTDLANKYAAMVEVSVNIFRQGQKRCIKTELNTQRYRAGKKSIDFSITCV